MKKTLPCFAALILLGACGETTVKETLGLDKRAPDEFRVVSRPPLSVPPQFDLVPPSVDGASSGTTTRAQAKSLVLGDGSLPADTKTTKVKSKNLPKGSASMSNADSMFLKKAGADQADPTIKQQLAEKRVNEQLAREDETWVDKVTTLPKGSEPVVKPKDEAERIKKNKETGKSVTEGKTPDTGSGTVSMINRWFGGDEE